MKGQAEVPFLDLPAQHAPLREEILEMIGSALDAAAFVGGAQLAAFEKEFAAFQGVRHAVGVANGTDALRLALQALGIGRGDRVVTVPNTFIATTEAISHVGADFEFVDIDASTCNMDPNRLESLLRERAGGPPALRPKAVIPVHLYGQCAEMEAIVALARKYGLKVIEDAAQAHGAKHRGQGAGAFGDAAGFSFYAGKNLGACGEAGAVATADPAIAERVRMLREHGQKEKYVHALEGSNARMDAIQAGILRIKLRRLESWNAARRQIAALYDAALKPLAWTRPVMVAPHNVSCYHLYVIHVPERERLQAHLKERGIHTGLHYPVPLHLQECYAGLGIGKGAFPNAEASAATLLSLPMFPELGAERVKRVVDAIAAFRA